MKVDDDFAVGLGAEFADGGIWVMNNPSPAVATILHKVRQMRRLTDQSVIQHVLAMEISRKCQWANERVLM